MKRKYLLSSPLLMVLRFRYSLYLPVGPSEKKSVDHLIVPTKYELFSMLKYDKTHRTTFNRIDERK